MSRRQALLAAGVGEGFATNLGKLHPKLRRFLRLFQRVVLCRQVLSRRLQPDDRWAGLLAQNLIPGPSLIRAMPVFKWLAESDSVACATAWRHSGSARAYCFLAKYTPARFEKAMPIR